MKSNRLEGDVAVVTGAASGLDRAAAIEMAQHGALIACTDIDSAKNQETVDEIMALGGEAFAVTMDVGNTESVKEAFAEIYRRAGKITILVNGAAIVRFSQLPEMPDDEWQQVVDINLTGTMRVLREVYPYMKKTGGRIVNISSTSGKSGGSWAGPHYVATKAAVIGLTKYCAKAWVKDGIRANVICPGTSETPLTDHKENKNIKASAVADVPMGRIGLPSDTAGAVMFLVSDESEYVTGISLDVTGGRYIYTN